jgi:hypothetical protein
VPIPEDVLPESPVEMPTQQSEPLRDQTDSSVIEEKAQVEEPGVQDKVKLTTGSLFSKF